jgi:hypothetical protein
MATSHQSDGFARMLTISLSVAFAAFVGMTLMMFGYLRPYNLKFYDFYYHIFVFAFPALWAILVLVAFVRYRLRGLWFLIGMPFALIWPTFGALISWTCRNGGC